MTSWTCVPVMSSRPMRGFTWRAKQRHRPGLEAMASAGGKHGFESLKEVSGWFHHDAVGLCLVSRYPIRDTSVMDRSTLGHPGKYTFCVAEDEEDSTWLPLSVERGIPAGTSAVTALQVESPHQIMNEWTHDPKEILDTYAAAIRSNMLTYSIWEGNYAFVIPKQHREIFAAAGWTKQNIREYTFEAARVKRGEWRTVGKAAVAGRKDEEKVYRALRSPDDLLIIAAGGPAGGFGAILPPWYGKKSLAVTVPISA